jgi:hypothetical protein
VGSPEKIGSTYKTAGIVEFDDHKLITAIRYWDIEESSGKSLFYAMNAATQSLQSDGMTACQANTNGYTKTIDAPSSGDSGSLDIKKIVIDCGVKQIRISLYLSDTPGTAPTSLEVTEWLQGK